jgi:subtilisin-like proprotein convertase family protein
MIRSARLSAAFVAAAAGLALVAGSASAQVFTVSPGLAIPASGTGGTTGSFITSEISVPSSITINDINVLINLNHTWDSDLDIFLVPPGGTSYLRLTTDNGGSGDNYRFTRFDQLASTSITAGAAPFNNNFRPEGGPFTAGDPWSNTLFALPATALTDLSSLNGSDAVGTWTLVIGDDAGGDVGTLLDWSIELNGVFDPRGPLPLEGPLPPQVTLTLTPDSGRLGVGVFNAFATVTPGANPVSTGITVSLNASSVDGGTITLLDNGVAPDAVAGDLIFSGSGAVGGGATVGVRTLTATASDAQGRVGVGTDTFNVLPPPPQWDETANGGGDAGDLPSSAQIPTGTDPFVSIAGDFPTTNDADLFTINICDVATFTANTFNADTTIDTQLFLFNPDGTGVTFNDDVPDGFPGDLSLQSRITGQFVAAAGNFLLGVSRYDNDPQDSAALPLWIDTPFNIERQPDGTGAANPVASWTGGALGTGTYRVDLTGTCFPTSVNLCNYDYNQDENVDLTDAQLMAQVAAGIITADPSWLSGDMNGDENADLTDAQQLAQFVASGICPI